MCTTPHHSYLIVDIVKAHVKFCFRLYINSKFIDHVVSPYNVIIEPGNGKKEIKLRKKNKQRGEFNKVMFFYLSRERACMDKRV